MALADILARIAEDTDANVSAIERDAEARAEALLSQARTEAAAASEKTLALADIAAKREAERIVVTSRLQARDTEVAARRALIEEALGGVAAKLAELPDHQYAVFLAKRIVKVARGSERLAIGTADTGRAEAIIAEVERQAPGNSLTRAEESAPFERGVLVIGDRTSADLSLPAIVAEQRAELEFVIARTLFGEER